MTATRAILLQRLEAEALQIRRNVWRALHAAGSGHVGGSASAADLLAALSFHTLHVRPHGPDWSYRDRFVLSKGHANAALAAVLAQAEFIEDALLERCYGYESPLEMHPDIKVAGVEMSTGGLGGAVAALLAVEHPTCMRLVGMPEDFAVVGPTVLLRAKYGMSTEAIAAACRSLLRAA